MRIIECEQATPEWFVAKRGVPSSSNFDRILTPKTRKLSAQAEDYICELIADLHNLGVPDGAENYVSRAMQNGIDVEPEARAWYEMDSGADVRRVGVILTDDGRFCCSPDGMVYEGDQPIRGHELKCPMLKTHTKYLIAGEVVPAEYLCQIHGGLWVTGLSEWEFVSYAPGMQPLVVRVVPDDFTEALGHALNSFWQRYKFCLHHVRKGGATVETSS